MFRLFIFSFYNKYFSSSVLSQYQQSWLGRKKARLSHLRAKSNVDKMFEGRPKDRVHNPPGGPDRHARQNEGGVPGAVLQHHGETLRQ